MKPLIITLIVCGLIALGALKLNQIQCASYSKNVNKEYKFSYMTGCYIKLADGFVPLETWRSLDK